MNRCSDYPAYLGHVDEPQRQRLVAQDGPILVALPPLQHDLQLVGVPLQEVRILREEEGGRERRDRRPFPPSPPPLLMSLLTRRIERVRCTSKSSHLLFAESQRVAKKKHSCGTISQTTTQLGQVWCVSACVDTRLSAFPLHVARQGKLKRPKFGSNVSAHWDPFWKAAAGQAANTHLFWFGVGKKKASINFL